MLVSALRTSLAQSSTNKCLKMVKQLTVRPLCPKTNYHLFELGLTGCHRATKRCFLILSHSFSFSLNLFIFLVVSICILLLSAILIYHSSSFLHFLSFSLDYYFFSIHLSLHPHSYLIFLSIFFLFAFINILFLCLSLPGSLS